MQDLLYSFNVVAPVFLIVALGYLLRHIFKPDHNIIGMIGKLVFYIGLPALVFINIYDADLAEVFVPKLVAYCLAFIVLEMAVLFIVVPRLVKERKKCSAVIHGIFRSNLLLLGYPVAVNMYGDTGAQVVALLMPFIIVIYNIFAVITLTVYDESRQEEMTWRFGGPIAKEVLRNPLVISSLIAVGFKLLNWQLPAILYAPVGNLAAMAVPLALILLGLQLDLGHMKGDLTMALPAALCRLLVIPFAAVLCGILLGFSGAQLGTVFVIFATPSAVSVYIMGTALKSDPYLSAEIVILTTLLCPVTLFLGIFILKVLGTI